MNLGFSSDVRLGDAVYQIQTEDRRAAHPVIDTVVHSQGRVLQLRFRCRSWDRTAQRW